MEYQYQLESQKREREAEERRRLQQLANEKKEREEEEQRRNAINTGTGFFVSSSGYLVTNQHVIDGSSYYAVRDLHGNFYRAELVAQDAGRDLAILRIYGVFPALKIARSDSVSKGQRVMAVGYPQISIQGNESKVTDGVISSFSGMNNDSNWFQISTPIQGGNSGGPLVTEAGQVVGVVVATANAMKFFKNTGNIPQNVNYAIKSNVLLSFLIEQNISNVGATSAKFTIDAVDRATVLVIAKNSPIDVNFTVSPEQRASQERERAKALAEDAKRQKLEAEAERKAQAAALAEEVRARKERQAFELQAREQASRKERRDRDIGKSVGNWKELLEDELFGAWLRAQSGDVQSKLDSPKAAEVVSIFKRFQTERRDFSESHFQSLGSWIAEKDGCRFFNPKPEPNESISWTGNCEDGRGTGQGELIWMRGGEPIQRLNGIFKYGMLNGLGRFEQIGAGYSEGIFKNGKLEGVGKAMRKDGSSYEGEYKQGKFFGRGRQIFSNGNVFEGDFVDGKPDGLGKLAWKEGGAYEGNFRIGKFDGVGKLVFRDGAVYEGDFRDGKRSGRGKLSFTNGNWMEGDFLNGNLEGAGKFVWVDGTTYVGAFKEGRPEGRGRKTLKNGDSYEGEFKGGKEDGAGIITFQGGRTRVVQMKEGKIISP